LCLITYTTGLSKRLSNRGFAVSTALRTMELVSECAKSNRASKTKYLKVWRALVSCTEAVLASGRGVHVEKVKRVNTKTAAIP